MLIRTQKLLKLLKVKLILIYLQIFLAIFVARYVYCI